MKKALLVALTVAIASLGLTACGGDDDTTGGGATTQTEETTDPGAETGGAAEGGSAGSAAVVDIESPPGTDLAYTTDQVSAEAGKVTINYTNPQVIGHDVAVEDPSGENIGKTEVIVEDSASTEVELKSGDYTFYCTVPGHREAGMEGTLTAK
jgi:uncharacterized cupredoxin-like copper-binding protein